MRILHIDPDDIDNPLSGGGPIRTFEIYRRLAQRHEITVLTPTFPGSKPETVREGIRYIRLGRRVGDHGSSHHITFFFALPGAIRKMKYDLLVEDMMPPMSATLNPLFNRKPLVGSVQWFFARALSRQYKLPFYLGERYLLRMYPRLVVLTEAMRRTVTAYHHRCDCRVIPNGVPDALLAAEGNYGDYILYLGRVDFFQKGVDLLLQAYSRIPPARRLPLVVAGHGFQWDAYQRLVTELGLDRWVTTLGRVDAIRRTELLSGCRFVCAPSREETFGMVILESCAAEKPVVLFDQEPMNEVAGPGCEFVPPFDVQAYSEAIARLSECDEAAMRDRGRRNRNRARRFRWDDIATEQENFYMQAVED